MKELMTKTRMLHITKLMSRDYYFAEESLKTYSMHA